MAINVQIKGLGFWLLMILANMRRDDPVGLIFFKLLHQWVFSRLSLSVCLFRLLLLSD